MKKCILLGNWVSKRSRKGLGETLTIKKHVLTFTLSVNKTIIVYQFSMFKSLDSIASVVGIFMYLTIFKQVLRSRKGLDYNTAMYNYWLSQKHKTFYLLTHVPSCKADDGIQHPLKSLSEVISGFVFGQ